jgi:hypothetical protein
VVRAQLEQTRQEEASTKARATGIRGRFGSQ